MRRLACFRRLAMISGKCTATAGGAGRFAEVSRRHQHMGNGPNGVPVLHSLRSESKPNGRC
jgi:hypothetical protein